MRYVHAGCTVLRSLASCCALTNAASGRLYKCSRYRRRVRPNMVRCGLERMLPYQIRRLVHRRAQLRQRPVLQEMRRQPR